MGNSKSSMEECQKAANDLATEWINSGESLANLTDENYQYYITQLQYMGVSNAEEVIMNRLAKNHAEAAWNTRDLTNATADEIDALANEKESTEEGVSAFKIYIAQKLLANAAIDPSGDISALESIVKSLGVASDAWVKYNTLRTQILEMDATAPTSINGQTYYTYTSYDANGKKHTHYRTEDQRNSDKAKYQAEID